MLWFLQCINMSPQDITSLSKALEARWKGKDSIYNTQSGKKSRFCQKRAKNKRVKESESQICECVRSTLYWNSLSTSGKDGLLASLFGQDGSRFVLSFWVVSQLWRAGGDWTLEDRLLQVIEHRCVLFSEEGQGCTTLTSTTCATNTMDVVCKREKRNNVYFSE